MGSTTLTALQAITEIMKGKPMKSFVGEENFMMRPNVAEWELEGRVDRV